MRRKPLFLILVFILIVFLSGCLPKVPEKITGPTWTSKYRIPLVKLVGENKIYFNHEPESENGKNLELEKLKTDLSFNFGTDADPLTFVLMDEQPTIDLGTDAIGDFTLEITGWDQGMSSVPPQEMNFQLSEDLEDYLNVTLSNNQTSANYIDIQLVGAKGSGEGLTILLFNGGTELDNEVIPTDGTTGRLNLSNLVLSPDTSLTIKVSGQLITTGEGEIGLTFNPGPLEIASFTISNDSGLLSSEDFEIGQVDETIDLGEMSGVELNLRTARLIFKPSFPENFQISAKLTLAACDENGVVLKDEKDEDISFSTNIILKDKDLAGPDDNKLDLLAEGTNLNTLLQAKPHQLKMSFGELKVEATGDLTLAYPEDKEICIGYELGFGVEDITFSEEEGFETGEIEVPDDLPVDFVSGELFLEIDNHSPAGLKIELWLSETKNSFDDKNRFTVQINPQDSQGAKISALKMTAEQFDLFTENDLLYYKIKITNLSDEAAGRPFDENDYLEISAWVDVEVKVNPR